MKASTKGLLIAGGIAVVGITIWLLVRPKNNGGVTPPGDITKELKKDLLLPKEEGSYFGLTLEEFQSMNLVQQAALAAAMGLSVDEVKNKINE
tara:strand:+ start:107 stop:385 length:279 start_codon:yes stop_codon:yes gene_type:complete